MDTDSTPDPLALTLAGLRQAALLAPPQSRARMLARARALWEVHHTLEREVHLLKNGAAGSGPSRPVVPAGLMPTGLLPTGGGGGGVG